MLDRVLRNVLPPVVYRAGAKIKKHAFGATNGGERLFDGDDALFKEVIAQARVYAEYGCGASTVWVAAHTAATILSTDSSDVWLDKVRQSCGGRTNLSLHHADVGAVGDWGRPVGYSRSENFADYTDWIWHEAVSPDTILVDGRFRVCCFLTSLVHADKDSRLVFDDYTNRPQYHFVEQFVKPARTCGRQALFYAPGQDALDLEKVRRAVDQFRFVMD